MLNFRVKGGFQDAQAKSIKRKFGRRGIEMLTASLDKATDDTVEDAISSARSKAPVLTGKLRNSIEKEKIAPMVREYGSDVEYATRQEYENPTRKAFFRESMWENEGAFRTKVRNAVNVWKVM